MVYGVLVIVGATLFSVLLLPLALNLNGSAPIHTKQTEQADSIITAFDMTYRQTYGEARPAGIVFGLVPEQPVPMVTIDVASEAELERCIAVIERIMLSEEIEEVNVSIARNGVGIVQRLRVGAQRETTRGE